MMKPFKHTRVFLFVFSVFSFLFISFFLILAWLCMVYKFVRGRVYAMRTSSFPPPFPHSSLPISPLPPRRGCEGGEERRESVGGEEDQQHHAEKSPESRGAEE